MTSLIERIEAAECPSRELDAMIWCALNGKKYIGWFEPYGEEGRATAVEYTEPPKRTRLVTHSRGHAPPYTSSIDAAMTLVPDGWQWSVNMDGTANVMIDQDMYSAIGYKNPALALCAAALRARGVE